MLPRGKLSWLIYYFIYEIKNSMWFCGELEIKKILTGVYPVTIYDYIFKRL